MVVKVWPALLQAPLHLRGSASVTNPQGGFSSAQRTYDCRESGAYVSASCNDVDGAALCAQLQPWLGRFRDTRALAFHPKIISFY